MSLLKKKCYIHYVLHITVSAAALSAMFAAAAPAAAVAPAA